MADTPESDPTVVEVPIDRRRLLTWMVAAPTLVVAARLGLEVPHAEAQDSAAAFDLFLALHPDGRIALTASFRSVYNSQVATGRQRMCAASMPCQLKWVRAYEQAMEGSLLLGLGRAERRGGNEDCTELFGDDGEWNDTGCDDMNNHVCALP